MAEAAAPPPPPSSQPPLPLSPPSASHFRPLVSPLSSPEDDTGLKYYHSDDLDIPPTPTLAAAPRLLSYFKDLDDDALEFEVASSPTAPETEEPPPPPPMPPPPLPPASTPRKNAPTPRAPLRELPPQSAGRATGGNRTGGNRTGGKATGGKATGGRPVPPSPAYSDLASPAPLEMSAVTRALLGAGETAAAPAAVLVAPDPERARDEERTLGSLGFDAVGGLSSSLSTLNLKASGLYYIDI